jgi:hypothetical protein
MATRILSSIRNLFGRRRVEEALSEEFQSSVEFLTEEKSKEGRSELEARRQALLELGEVRAARAGVFWRISRGICVSPFARWPSRPALPL